MKKYQFILLVAIAFVACSNDTPIEEEQVEKKQVEGIQVELDSVCEKAFGYAASFSLPSTIQLSDQNLGVIHSAEELAGIEVQDQKLPNVDFGKNDLVLGIVRTPDTGYSIENIDLREEDDAYQLNVYIKKHEGGFEMISSFLYWGVYPKLSDKPIDVVLLTADGAQFPSYNL